MGDISTLQDPSVIETDVNLMNQTDRKEMERSLIKTMAGCFTVNFKFAETFAPDKNYQYHDRKFSQAKEYVLILEETEDKISLLHLLFVSQNMVIKHWRQDWLYENREFLSYSKDNEWVRKEITWEEAAGTWTQKVFQVDDTPRYQGYGTWVHVDGRHFWESDTDAPLPRREITKRNDYNVLKRHSHIEIFRDGSWILDQDNEKIIRSGKGNADILLCMEKGLETFTLEDYDPQVAINWWENHKAFWLEVKDCWEELFNRKDRLKVQEMVDEKVMYMKLFELAGKFEGEAFDQDKAKSAIHRVFETYVEDFWN